MNKIELLHGKDLEEYRARVDFQKRQEPKHDNAWARSFINLPFETKVNIAITRIIEWIIYHEGQVYISYSGGKDSTVLLHMTRYVFPQIEAVFCNTGLEYPEIVEHVLQGENVTEIKPSISYKQVLEKYGYPFPTKEIAHWIECARSGAPSAIAKMNGTYKDKDGNPSRYCAKKWSFLIDSPFKISDKCCDVMKKKPFIDFEKRTGKKSIIGTTAAESYMRKTDWQKNGCNAYNGKQQRSKPLSAFTEQDILRYISQLGLELPSVYGDIVKDDNGQLSTTGLHRTGCMGCMFGCHRDKEPNRFQSMAVTHPKHWNAYINKMGYAEILDYIGVKY